MCSLPLPEGSDAREIWAGEIAAGVSAGTISPDNIGAAAAKGPYGTDAAAIEAKTRGYLAQGEDGNLKTLAAQIAGGVLSGGAVLGGQKLLSKALGSGQLSALLKATREIVMRSTIPGEGGSLNLGPLKKYYDAARELGIPDAQLNTYVNGALHLFGTKGRNALQRHKFEGVLKSFGGNEVAAYKSILNRMQYLVDEGSLAEGVFLRPDISINGYLITVEGRVIKGMARISSAYIP